MKKTTNNNDDGNFRFDSVKFRLFPRYTEYSENNKYAFSGISMILLNPFVVEGVAHTAHLIKIGDAPPKRSPMLLDPVYWVVGTTNIIRLVGQSREPQLERDAVEVIECSIAPAASLETLDRVRAVKRFLETEAWQLPYWSGRDLRASLYGWSRDAVAVLLGVQPHYGLFVNGVATQWYTPSDKAVMAALERFECRQEEPIPLTIDGVRSYPLSEDPADGWGREYWEATYTIYLD